jgi:hypothetical protein
VRLGAPSRREGPRFTPPGRPHATSYKGMLPAPEPSGRFTRLGLCAQMFDYTGAMPSKSSAAVPEHWRPQSVVTDLGGFSTLIDELPSDLASLRRASQQLVVHYTSSGDEAENGGAAARIGEVDTRYAEAMFARILALGPPALTRERPPGERIVGCCRDFTVLFVAMTRHKGIPARARHGFATYFAPGWFIDHVIAEVWDQGEARWRLVEPEITDEFARSGEGGAFDPLDVPADRFVIGPLAWIAARSGLEDPERFVVAPDLE